MQNQEIQEEKTRVGVNINVKKEKIVTYQVHRHDSQNELYKAV